MKTTFFFIAILFLLSCRNPSKENLILGEWKIITWIDARINGDILKIDGAPNYEVFFKKDTVHVYESEKGETRNYKFKWEIQNDSLRVRSLGTLKFVSIDEERCILEIYTRNIFTEEKDLYLETITLMKK